MKLILACACDDAAVRSDGKLDIHGIFNELYAPGFPAVQERMTVVFVVEWERDRSGRVPLRADLVDDTDQKALTIQGHTDVDARSDDRAPSRTQLILPLERVIFPKPGSYRFELKLGDETCSAVTLFLGERPED